MYVTDKPKMKDDVYLPQDKEGNGIGMGPSSQEGAVKEEKFPYIRKPLTVETGVPLEPERRAQ